MCSGPDVNFLGDEGLFALNPLADGFITVVLQIEEVVYLWTDLDLA